MESLLKRIERNRREHDRLIALVLCLSLIVSMGTFAVFHKKAVAKTYTRQVLDCPLAAEGAGLVVHTHNDDCYDENHNLVCTLPELEAHTHSDACYTEVPVQVCGLAESVGHVHGSDCRTLMLTCEEEEREATLDEEGNVADAGHIHTPDCYSEVLSCGMEEGVGAHTHTDACYETEYLLTCDKPEVLPHVHSDDCYQKNEDGSIYVDENGYSWLTCGLPEVVQHVHGPECFTVYELDDGEPEEAEEDEETTDTTDTTDTEDMTVPALPMPAQSWERTAGGIKVSVEAPEGAFPENTRIAVTPVNGSSLMDTVSDAVNGEVLEVQAVDITFFDAEGREIEPAVPIRVVMTPAATEHAEEKTSVVHVDITQQTAELIEQAAGTEFDNSEVVFDADAFTIYAIVFTYEVNYEYEVDGRVYTSSMPGAEDMPLSEIVRGLGIVDEAELETFLSRIATVVSTNTEVATVEATAGDWTIRAVKDGNAYINVTMQDGSVFSVKAEATGVTEISDENEVATVSTVNDLYLPAAGEVKAELLTEEQSETVISAVQTATETDESSAATYQAFSISLENVDVTAYDGFNVSVTLPEDAVIGKDFQLYQVREDGTATDLTENLTVTSVPNDNGLQNVSGIRFKTEDFADFVLSYSIGTNYTAFDGKTFKISLNYGPEAEIPDGAELKVEEILPETETFAQYLNDSVTELGVKSRTVSFARFFDIEIQKDGEKIEPKAPVSVKIEMMNLPEETENAEAQVIHFGEQTEVLSAEAVGTDVSFETGSFSVYGVVYTVDFHYEINGQTFEFSIPGGGFISLEHLIEALGIQVGDAHGINNIANGAIEKESAESTAEEIEAAWAAEPEAAGTEENGNVDAAAAYEQAIHLNNIPVSEETRAFIEDIESVEFSSPELVWVGKTEAESTVGALKETNGLEIEYSANLTEEQIAEINAQTVEAGDWALISVRPFLSEESLTVTMKNGDRFTIRVTDGQIRKTVIDARGDTWEITVTYGDDAQIPDGAELKVEEILPEDEEYQDYYQKSMEMAGVTASAEDELKTVDDSADELLPENTDAADSITETNVTEAPEETKKAPKKVISDYIRMFDIKIRADEQEIEPAAPVVVRIRLLDAPEDVKAVPQVIHFAKYGEVRIELKEQASNSASDSLLFTADEFSVYSVVYTVDFHWEVNGKTFDFSIPGGGFVSLEQLVEVLGINGAEIESESSDESEDQNDDAAPLMLEDVIVSEATKEFVADVESVEFSKPELVWVGKVEEETTVGGLKETNEIEVQYSAELTEEQIAEINAQTVDAGDWALISMHPFTSEETLTVTMKDGEVFTIRVTDASYTATKITDLDGKTGALVNNNGYNNTWLHNALQSSAHTTNGRLNAIEVTITDGKIDTTSGSLTKWKFQKVEGTNDQYYISASENEYLNINSSGLFVTSDRQALVVQRDSSNRIRIHAGDTDGNGSNTAVNCAGNSTYNGYGAYKNNWMGNPGEWFDFYEVEEVFPVTLHFVKEDGTSFAAGEVTYADGTPVEIVNGNFKINPEKLEIGADGIIDLNQFLINGFTLGNTHKSTWQDINDSNDNYTHSIIGNELKWNNGTLQYRLFYTNHDKAGSWWFDAGKEPTRDFNHWSYNNGSDPSDHTAVADNDANPYDYYLVYDPIPISSGSPSGHTPSGESIDDIGKDKTLTPNGDGTYTMDLSVSAHAKGHEESNGINLVIVFDTSSSMRRSVDNANTQYGDNEFKNHDDSRFIQARNALNTFLDDLLPDDNASTNKVQLALVDFNYSASTHTFNGGTGTPAYWTNSADTFMTTLDSLSCPSGTNWAQGLDTAKTVAAAGDGDPTYILLMTDGAPSQYWDPSSKNGYFVSGEGCYLGARDEARDVVNAGYELYGVFSFGDSTDENNKYLEKLVDYAYNKNVHSDHSYYASDPEKLEQALKSIFGILKERVAHIAVNYQDGIAMDTTSTALSANVGGNLGSITYSKTGGTTADYSVTTDASGNAVFEIGGSTYPGDTDTITYTKISGSSSEEGGSGITVDENATATVYKYTVGSGDDAKTFYMPIATLETNTITKVGDLNWDLSPLGMLEEGATYKISFVVWPNQEAYDYVAKLNNGLMTWGADSTPTPVYASDGTTLLYDKNGVANYPNIVRYPNGIFAVLTNTIQEVTYYIATEDTFNTSDETTYTGQYTVNPVAPDPMPLTASSSQIEKVWNISRDPDILAQLLYGDPENPYSIDFDILQDESTKPYTSVGLGWDAEQRKYIWNSTDLIYVKWDDAQNKFVRCSQGDEDAREIGTHWAESFSIATGLMLSEARMDALGLDKTAYTSTAYPEEGGTKYYLLEEGHDYTISEPDVGYEFDFEAPVYHPMLVDGDLKNVDLENIVKDGNGKITSYNITGMSTIDVASDGRSALTINNTLRGYLHLEKRVLGNDGNVNPSDDTEFEFTITVSNEDGLFEENHIPWFAVNDCFYHTVDEDDEWHYYQVDKVSVSEGNTTWRVITEKGSSGPTYTFTSDSFDEDVAGKQTITCTNINDANDTITLEIYGNQTTPDPADSKTTIKLTRSIRQDQKLTIGNIPAGSTYTVEETVEYGYVLNTTSDNTSGTIIPNSDTNVIFTNKKISTDVNILKKKENGEGLSGAVFQLRTVKKTEGDNKGVEELASVEIGGVDDFNRKINGEQKEFKSAFETTDAAHTLTNLPDGTYRLYEVYVPAGYINTLPYIEFDVSNGTVTCSMADDEEKVGFDGTGTISLITITNTPGVQLPNTGGPGTRLFTVLGSILILGAGVLLWRRRRTI